MKKVTHSRRSVFFLTTLVLMVCSLCVSVLSACAKKDVESAESGNEVGVYYYDNTTEEYVFWDSDDDYDEDGNFNLILNLEANQTYYLAANFYSSYDTGSFTVGLSTNPNAYKEDSQPTPTPEPVKPAPSATTTSPSFRPLSTIYSFPLFKG